jgi:hypothetical protein
MVLSLSPSSAPQYQFSLLVYNSCMFSLSLEEAIRLRIADIANATPLQLTIGNHPFLLQCSLYLLDFLVLTYAKGMGMADDNEFGTFALATTSAIDNHALCFVLHNTTI